MYNIEKTSYGFFLTFGGHVDAGELTAWLEESGRLLESMRGPFGVLVDMRTLEILDRSAREVIIKGQKLYKEKGMQRSAVVVNSALTNLQFQRIALASDISRQERYIDEWQTINWRRAAEDWVIRGKEPEKSAALFTAQAEKE